jgi:hypothetical protein
MKKIELMYFLYCKMELISAVLGAFNGYYDDHSSLPCKGPQIAPELMRAILMRTDMPAIMAARQCARFVDKLMDTHFWLEKFEHHNGVIMALKLPNTVSGWIREYILVSRVFVEVNKLLEYNNCIQMREIKVVLNTNLKTQFELLLPNTTLENGRDEFGFTMASSDDNPIGYTEVPIYFALIGYNIMGLEYPFNSPQFLARLLYYCPFVHLTDECGNPIRMRY